MAKILGEEAVTRYFRTYTGQELLKKHSLGEKGIWRIRGEDPNCDFGGFHHNPELGIVEGTLEDVITYGVSLPSFWTWGSGGNFELIGEKIPKVDLTAIKQREAIETRLNELEKEAESLRRQLKKFE